MLHLKAQQALPLPAGDGQRGRRGEAGNDGDGDEVDEEAELEEAAQEDDQPREEGEQHGVLRAVLGVHAGHQGHDGGGADGDVFAGPEHAVDETSHEGGVEAVLGRQPRHHGVGDALGDHSQPYCQAGDEVRYGGVEVILGQPPRDGQPLVQALLVVTSYSSPSSFEPL